MAPLPKRRHSSNRQGKRRFADRQTVPAMMTCPKCGLTKIPHQACSGCGYYSESIQVPQRQKRVKDKTA